MEACAAFLRDLHPDLLCLQEVRPAAWKLLRDRLPVRDAAYAPRIDGRAAGEGVPALLLSDQWHCAHKERFWFSETPDTPSVSWRAAHPRVCSVLRLRPANAPDTSSALHLFNLHLDHRSRRSRARSLGLLRERIHSTAVSGDHIVICGDFNMPGYRKEVRDFLAGTPPLRDATHHHPIGAVRPTYLGWGPFRLAKARIDLCLHSPGLHADHYHAVTPEHRGQTISDHRAVVVDFSSSDD